MAIAEMLRLKVVGLTKERDTIFNALAFSRCAEIKNTEVLVDTSLTERPLEKAELEKKISELNECIEYVSFFTENYAKEHKIKDQVRATSPELDFNSFIEAKKDTDRVFSVMKRISSINDMIFASKNAVTQAETTLKQLVPYKNVEKSFGRFTDTKLAKVYFGTLPSDKIKVFTEWADNANAVDYETWAGTVDYSPVAMAAHKSVAEDAFAFINSLGFQRCPFAGDLTVLQIKTDNEKTVKCCIEQIKQLEEELFSFNQELAPMKVLSDYYSFELEKIEAAEKSPGTATCFITEAYVPKDGKERVIEALNKNSKYVCYEFLEVDKDEMPPTLMKNNKVVKNFEFVTNMYSAPNYKEQDPNPIMSIFFSIFLGFIMGDAGYGLLMIVGGFLYAAKCKRDSGIKRLANVIGIGGIFAVIFGVLFGSYFGFSPVASDTNQFALSFLPKPLLPDPQKAMASLAGITVPAVLLISLGMGVVQLMASNAFKAYSEFKKGNVCDGIFFGLIWVVFLGGMAVMAIGLITELNLPNLVLPGAITAVAALVIAAVTAGMHVSGINKFTKGFGAVYGVINYLSDILSYARLYGLMLSGAVIAQIVSGQGMLLVTGGNAIFTILGVIVIIIGHAFNLAMNLLGAYIHDARLQYIEFFSRFYTGDGELFTPLGSKRKYVYLK